MPVSVCKSVDPQVDRLQDNPPRVSLLESGEKLFSPAGLAKALTVPGHRGGLHLNGSTIFRYIGKGSRDRSGKPVRLEAVRVGSRWLTSVEAFSRFTSKLTDSALVTDTSTDTPAPTPKARDRAAARASKELDVMLGTVTA